MSIIGSIRPLPDATCPSCSRRLPDDDLNVDANLANCRSYGRTFRLSDLLDARVDRVDLQHLPPEPGTSRAPEALSSELPRAPQWLGWSRRFRWSEARSIREEAVSRGRGTAKVILIEANRESLSAPRQALESTLTPPPQRTRAFSRF